MKKNLMLILLSLLCGVLIAEGPILHCWCWSFKTIEENLPKIAQAGFKAVQTSPANTCLEGDNGGLELMSKESGKWYYHYQPVDWKIGNYQLGTREDFISLCAAAKKYDIRVIVDVVPNHTTPETSAVSASFIEACGGLEKMYHPSGLGTSSNFSRRMSLTNRNQGGLPDVDTENKGFQKYFLAYLNDLVDCGAGGFRFDMAKHIALPDEPAENPEEPNDFWQIFTGRKSIDGQKLKNAEKLFIYGEVLQDKDSREADYAEYIKVTASTHGSTVRFAVTQNDLRKGRFKTFNHAATDSQLVTWVESHDTYANEGTSAGMTDFQLRAGWALIAGRKGGTPLFFSRPKGAESTQFPGASRIGEAGNDQFFHPEVVAVNKLRNYCIEKNADSETMENFGNSCLAIARGTGDQFNCFVIINSDSSASAKITMPTSLKRGTYYDKANNLKFTVSRGNLTGTVPAGKIAVIMPE
ncbi:MAG: alpha-amylase family glycosyl hydrolase [Treponemataceae bacterium]|nr:alpha-amylase family glycosyl hydrolase [Treponemataceae bacterium]